MPGLIVHPGQIWLAVEPVDMRRGIDGLSMVVQQSLGHSPCAGSAFVYFAIVRAIVSRCCYGMGRVYGYVSAVCIRYGLSGRSWVMVVLR
jgi:hypothetical protein